MPRAIPICISRDGRTTGSCCGAQTDTQELDRLVAAGKRPAVQEWLKRQIWYSTADGMGHPRNFWETNFDCLPDFRPNYVLPHFGAILRCMRNGRGFAVVSDLLCRKDLDEKSVRVAWKGDPIGENMLHFGKRKKTRFAGEIRQLEEILTKNWAFRA